MGILLIQMPDFLFIVLKYKVLSKFRIQADKHVRVFAEEFSDLRNVLNPFLSSNMSKKGAPF